MSVQREHRAPGAGAGEPAGEPRPKTPTPLFHAAGRPKLLRTLKNPGKYTLGAPLRPHLPALFHFYGTRRFPARAEANLTPGSKSENSPQILRGDFDPEPLLHALSKTSNVSALVLISDDDADSFECLAANLPRLA